jgi:hypothetical protein
MMHTFMISLLIAANAVPAATSVDEFAEKRLRFLAASLVPQ